MSLRDVEGPLAERGIDVSYETVRCWGGRVIIKSMNIEQKDEAQIQSLRKHDAVALAAQVVIFIACSAALVTLR